MNYAKMFLLASAAMLVVAAAGCGEKEVHNAPLEFGPLPETCGFEWSETLATALPSEGTFIAVGEVDTKRVRIRSIRNITVSDPRNVPVPLVVERSTLQTDEEGYITRLRLYFPIEGKPSDTDGRYTLWWGGHVHARNMAIARILLSPSRAGEYLSFRILPETSSGPPIVHLLLGISALAAAGIGAIAYGRRRRRRKPVTPYLPYF